jgi:hypothetical protein
MKNPRQTPAVGITECFLLGDFLPMGTAGGKEASVESWQGMHLYLGIYKEATIQ